MVSRFTENDVGELMRIWLEENLSAHAFIPAQYFYNHLDMVREALPQSELYVYRQREKIIGFAGIVPQSYMAGIFVEKQFQNQGVGRALLNHCKGIYPKLKLDVYAKNINAIHFYRRNLFHATSETFQQDTGELEYHMVWEGEKVGRSLQTIPGVGKNMEQHLVALGYHCVEDLNGQTPEEMYRQDCLLQGVQLDRCVLYVYRLAVYFAEHDTYEAEKLKWWNWKDK